MFVSVFNKHEKICLITMTINTSIQNKSILLFLSSSNKNAKNIHFSYYFQLITIIERL